MRAIAVMLVLAVGLGSTASLGQAEWRSYENARFGYTAELPTTGFSATETDKGLTLLEEGGRGQIDIFGAANAERLGPAQYEQVLAGADRISEITYARRGQSWLVVSGYYKRDAQRGDNLIFYAKFMFSGDRRTIAGFEASYPSESREKFDPIVERMEDHLTAPH